MSLERLVPNTLKAGETTGLASLALHLERYRFAAEHLQPGRVLDIACGVGYGAVEMLRLKPQSVAEVIAVDNAPASLALAHASYTHPRITYVLADALTFHSAEPFDSIVSLETIEHLPEPQIFIGQMLRLLKPHGRLICSVPVTPSVDVNPFHLHDFTEKSFRALFQPFCLREVGVLRQVQPFDLLPILLRKEARSRETRPNLLGYYLQHPRLLLKRMKATLQHGLANHYITIAWEKNQEVRLRQ